MDAESTDDCSVVYNSDNEFLAPEVKMFISAPNIYWPVSSPCIQPESLVDCWDSKILARRSKEDDTELENTKIDSPIRKVKKKIIKSCKSIPGLAPPCVSLPPCNEH